MDNLNAWRVRTAGCSVQLKRDVSRRECAVGGPGRQVSGREYARTCNGAASGTSSAAVRPRFVPCRMRNERRRGVDAGLAIELRRRGHIKLQLPCGGQRSRLHRAVRPRAQHVCEERDSNVGGRKLALHVGLHAWRHAHRGEPCPPVSEPKYLCILPACLPAYCLRSTACSCGCVPVDVCVRACVRT